VISVSSTAGFYSYLLHVLSLWLESAACKHVRIVGVLWTDQAFMKASGHLQADRQQLHLLAMAAYLACVGPGLRYKGFL
jgi:hypothetical protein